MDVDTIKETQIIQESKHSVAVQSMEGNVKHLFGSSGTWNTRMFFAGMGKKWNAKKGKSLEPGGGVIGVPSIQMEKVMAPHSSTLA